MTKSATTTVSCPENGGQISKADAAAVMYGQGSKQHLAAIKRFGK